ncbi:Homeodomain-like protein [Glomus cerebriforme]|uniref:Homeodomain-like protein n=1 Tax=Glomus cerebriforme TaxID=658196 RepID=A0A397TRV3_9GLOM|nr:Homeodomain-like protein [Glomus cerebriforme]
MIFSFEILSVRKGRWTKSEDCLLRSLVQEYGITNLSLIQKGFKNKRNTKQIRDRWINHLDPSINKKRKFNEEEERIIEENKCKWTEAAKKIPGASPLMIKNYYNNNLRKKIKTQISKLSNISNDRLLTLATIATSKICHSA